MLADTNPSLLVFLYLLAAMLGGPALYVLLYSVTHIILWLFPAPVIDGVQQSSNTNNMQLELQPDTHVGCPDGLCYLPLFNTRNRD